MGILRTDKISGLETPTPVTGSVVFDGTGDYLDATVEVLSANNFTFEMWINTSDTSTGYLTVFEYGQHNSSSNGIICQVRNTGGVTGIYTRNGTTDTSGAGISSPYPIKVSEWNHIAITRDGTTVRLHVNGIYTGSETWSKDFTATDLRIASARYLSGEHFDGYISNFRMLNGTALYGSADFIVPTHELEVIKDTIILCCNNPDSAGAASYAGIGTSKTITVNGDAAGSTVSPGLTRDFTYGTEFKGVTTFDTQGYFVPPSGTTEQRDISLSTKPGGSGRAVSFAGEQSPLSPSVIKAIDTIVIPSLGDATDFGDLSQDNRKNTAASSSTRGLCVDGATPGATNVIEFITFAATGSSTDFGDTVQNVIQSGGASNGIRGVFAGGYNDADFMEYVTIATEGNAQDFGDLIQRRFDLAGFASPTRGVFAGGKFTPSPTINQMNSIEYITIASTGNAKDFGDMTFASRGPVGTSSQIRGVIGGGFTTSPSNASFNSIDFITISTTGNGFDFGDLTSARAEIFGSTSNSLRAVFMGGDNAPGGSRVNTIDFVQIQTTGNAVNFGDLTTPKSGASACSDSHGGLS